MVCEVSEGCSCRSFFSREESKWRVSAQITRGWYISARPFGLRYETNTYAPLELYLFIFIFGVPFGILERTEVNFLFVSSSFDYSESSLRGLLADIVCVPIYIYACKYHRFSTSSRRQK